MGRTDPSHCHISPPFASFPCPHQEGRTVLRPRQEGPFYEPRTLEGPAPAPLWPWPSLQDEESLGPHGHIPMEPVSSEIPYTDGQILCPVSADLLLGSFFQRADTLLIFRPSAQRVASGWVFVGGVDELGHEPISLGVRPLAVWAGARLGLRELPPAPPPFRTAPRGVQESKVKPSGLL